MEWSKVREALSARVPWRLKTVMLVFLLSCIASSSGFLHAQTCYAVSPSGSGAKNGSDWNDALAGIPSTQTRGAIYWLADGVYLSSGQVIFQQAASGTSTIEFRKAQSYSYGRSSDGCSNDISAGWNASTMGSSQASFTGSSTWYIVTSYYIFNGNGSSTAPGCGGGGSTSTANNTTVVASPPTPSDCGLKVVGSGNGTSGATNIISLNSGNNTTLKYVEMLGAGYSGTSGNGDLEIFGPNTSGLFIEHMYAHNAGCVYIQDVGNGTTIDHSYFWATQPNGSAGCSRTGGV